MKISCPNCGAHYEIDPTLDGRKLRCGKCSKAFVWVADEGRALPFLEAGDVAAAAPPPPPSQEPAGDSPPPPPPPPPQQIRSRSDSPSGGSSGVTAALWIILLLIVAGGIYYALHRTGGQPTSLPSATPPAKIAAPSTTPSAIPSATTTPAAAAPAATGAAQRAANYEDALALAKQTGKDIVVFQRGSDWNRLGETLYHQVWMTDDFARALGSDYVLVAVDHPEVVGGQPLDGTSGPDYSPLDLSDSDTADTAPGRLGKLASATALPVDEVTSITTEDGSTFKQRADGAWLAAGANPDHETLTLHIKPSAAGGVVRIDFPTDPTLPGNGPGRASNGNFAISKVVVLIGGQPVKLDAAWADTSDADSGPWQTIDDAPSKPDKVWNPDADRHERRTLLLVLDSPAPAGADLAVQIMCNSQWNAHVPGCITAAMLGGSQVAADIRLVSSAQVEQSRNGKFTWWDTSHCPRVALMDGQNRAVASEDKPRLGLTPQSLAERVRQMRAIQDKRDALWAQAEQAQGPQKAELLRQGLAVLGFANWQGNDNCYKPIQDEIRAADPKDESGATRWLGFGGDPRSGVPWAQPDWTKALAAPSPSDQDYKEALARIDKELNDPRNSLLDHERMQRIMLARFLVYKRWPDHDRKRFDVQQEIADFDPDTFWGIGARGYLAMLHWTPAPMLTYGWTHEQVKPGVNVWDMKDTAYFFDHAGHYTVRLTTNGGADTLKVKRIALMDGATVIDGTSPNQDLGPANKTVEAPLNLADWRPDRALVLHVEMEVEPGHGDSQGLFDVQPQLPTKGDATAQASAPAIDFAAFQQKLGNTLTLEMLRDSAGPDRILTTPALHAALAQYEVIRCCGAKALTDVAARQGGTALIDTLFKDTAWMESFVGSDAADWAQSLENLRVLSVYGEGLDKPFARRVATALALQWGANSSYRLVDRLHDILDADRNGLLHISFEKLNVREMRWAVPTAGTHKDYQFLLDDRQDTVSGYFGACNAIGYIDPNVYGDSVQGWLYIAPWTHYYGTGTGDRPFPAHRVVGGVCGTLSGYGSAAARFHGIMSTTVGQPGHCAYIIRTGQEWPVGNSVTWPTSAGVPGWDGAGYSTLHRLYEPVEQDKAHYMPALRLQWMAHVAVDHCRDQYHALTVTDHAWIAAYQRAIAEQPVNYSVWLDYIKACESAKDVPQQTWLDLAHSAAHTFAVCNEAGWALAQRCFDKAAQAMPPAQREAFLLQCHEELRQASWVKPEGYGIDGNFNWQADKIGDPSVAVDFFGKLLQIHYDPNPANNWLFGKVLEWGANRFAGNPATASAYAQIMGQFFQARGSSLDPGLVSGALNTGIRKSSEAGDIVSYHVWTGLAAKLLPPLKPEDVYLNKDQLAAAPRLPVYPGALLSQDGMLQTSSACEFDRPLSYRNILAGVPGWFDTNSEQNPWAQVQLPGQGQLAGIVLVNRYEYAPTQEEFQWAVPMKVSISNDGKAWTQVASVDKADSVFCIDLRGRNLTARYVRVERPPSSDATRQPGRFHFRNFLVYGTKMY